MAATSGALRVEAHLPDGSTRPTSASYDNTYEIVEFRPATTGTFTIEVYKYRCDLSPRWLGFAYFAL